MDSSIKSVVCPICGTEYNGQEVDIIKKNGKIVTLETKCIGCMTSYTFQTEENNIEWGVSNGN